MDDFLDKLNVYSSHFTHKPKFKKYGSKYWILQNNTCIEIITNYGCYRMYLERGWITDFRSGSSLIDWFVPKKGNDSYFAFVLFHDACYSGWMSKELADEILRRGMIISGISRFRANTAINVVKLAGTKGHYYELGVELPKPYTNNRPLERYFWDPT